MIETDQRRYIQNHKINLPKIRWEVDCGGGADWTILGKIRLNFNTYIVQSEASNRKTCWLASLAAKRSFTVKLTVHLCFSQWIQDSRPQRLFQLHRAPRRTLIDIPSR